GIWEIRGEPRDFVYSKLMCWVALDRAIALAPQLGAGDRAQGWAAARDEIRAAIFSRGWSEKAGAFTQAFGGDHRRDRRAPDRQARPGIPLPRSRRPGRGGGHLPAVHILAGTGSSAGRGA